MSWRAVADGTERPPLIILDQLWQLGGVPKAWRKANVTAVFREGKKEDPGNHKLSSLTSFPGKVVEQLMSETIFRPVKDKSAWLC